MREATRRDKSQGVVVVLERGCFALERKEGITTLKDRGHNIFSLTYVPEYFELFEFISDALSLSAKVL